MFLLVIFKTILQTNKNIDKYKQFNISLYEPEIMGGYVMLEDRDEMLICKSSYDHTPKNN